jgi:hypothetical protein
MTGKDAGRLELLVRAFYAASLLALAMHVLMILTGSTDTARLYAAFMETQIRQGMWLELLGNPLAWVCAIFVAALAAVLVSLLGYAALQLRGRAGATSRSPRR